MQIATIADVQANLPAMLQSLVPGEELLITEAGRPVAKLRATEIVTRERVLGRGKGNLISYIEDDEHLRDFEDYSP